MMRFSFRGTLGAGILTLILAACRAEATNVDITTATATSRTSPTGVVPTIPQTAAPTTQTAVPSDHAAAPPLPTPQTAEAGIVLAFILAYNTGDLDAAVALLDDGVGVSDCDYQRVRPIGFMGKAAVTDWLRQRMADHDQLTVQEIEVGGGAVGVGYARRTSDTLRKLGFADGIRPQSATKVILTSDRKRIAMFANGPVGGDPETCRPAN